MGIGVTRGEELHREANLAPAAVILMAALAVMGATGCQSDARAGRPTNSGSAPATVVTVVIRDLKFEPATVTVHTGDAVEWKNNDIVSHTATADGDAQRPAFDSGTIRTGTAWRYVARNNGTYNYICTLHPNMEGTLIIQ